MAPALRCFPGTQCQDQVGLDSGCAPATVLASALLPRLEKVGLGACRRRASSLCQGESSFRHFLRLQAESGGCQAGGQRALCWCQVSPSSSPPSPVSRPCRQWVPSLSLRDEFFTGFLLRASGFGFALDHACLQLAVRPRGGHKPRNVQGPPWFPCSHPESCQQARSGSPAGASV